MTHSTVKVKLKYRGSLLSVSASSSLFQRYLLWSLTTPWLRNSLSPCVAVFLFGLFVYCLFLLLGYKSPEGRHHGKISSGRDGSLGHGQRKSQRFKEGSSQWKYPGVGRVRCLSVWWGLTWTRLPAGARERDVGSNPEVPRVGAAEIRWVRIWTRGIKLYVDVFEVEGMYWVDKCFKTEGELKKFVMEYYSSA